MTTSKTKLYDAIKINDFRDLVAKYKTKYKDKLAFIYKENYKNTTYIKKTYTDFASDIEKLGSSLLHLGLENKKVAIISPNRYEWCVSYLAITTSNIIVVPLDKALPDNEIVDLIQRSECEAIIFDSKYIDILNSVRNSSNTNLKYLICMDDLINTQSHNILLYPDLLKYGDNLLKESTNLYNDIKIDNKKTSILLFTSGTTSTSKAVMLSQDNICSDIYALDCITDIRQDDTFLSFLPLHHTFESSCTFLYGTFSGITIAFCDGLKHVSKNLKEYHITAFVAVPLMLEIMYKKIQKAIDEQRKTKLIHFMRKFSNFLLKFKIDIRRPLFKPILKNIDEDLRLLISGGAPMNKEAIQAFNDFGINLLQGYGLTETSPVIAGENDKYKRAGSVGFPLPETQIKIDNPDENGIGEIIVKGPTVMSGYYKNEKATEEVLKNGWFYTGDLGYFDKDGFLYITGRKKYVIVLKNGKNIFPEEIETLINKLPYIEESMVYGKPHKDDDYKLCVKVVYKKDYLKEKYPELNEEDYTEFIFKDIKEINKQLPAYKYIKEIICTDIPLIKTTTQKIKRREEMKLILKENID